MCKAMDEIEGSLKLNINVVPIIPVKCIESSRLNSFLTMISKASTKKGLDALWLWVFWLFGQSQLRSIIVFQICA